MAEATKIGVIGCGNISGIYLKNSQLFPVLETVACADLYRDRAKAKAQEFNVPKACTVEELLADPEIQIVVNLTIPKGTSSGQTFRLRGKGVKNSTTGATGDHFVSVKIVLPDEIDDGLAYYLTEWRQKHGYDPRR